MSTQLVLKWNSIDLQKNNFYLFEQKHCYDGVVQFSIL